MTLLKKMVTGEAPRNLLIYTRLLDDIFDRRLPILYPNVQETMSGLVLATLATRMERLQENPHSLMTYSTLTGLIGECEKLTTHPLLGQYTTGILALSYYEWKEKLWKMP